MTWARKLTSLATPMSQADVDALRAAGLDDAAVRSLAQVVGYFNYVNRHVEGLGITLEADHPGRVFGDLALKT
ncbi:MAG: hypothetical protein U0228_37620 [Myxococcaceae bacterium]